MKHFSGIITSWYSQNKRDLPWRNTNDAYLIWLSEIILQQTRVDQGMAYYLKFAGAFPTVKHLAKADNDKVMKLWQGLGYYSRARNLHATAKIVCTDFNGVFPSEYNDILSLKGIGEYTASAIASFAFNKPHAVVDGNVYRVLSRVFGVESAIDSTTGKKEFSKLANELLDKKNPAAHNQAIMEFGALQCKPVNPDCSVCPMNSHCYAFAKKRVNVLPVKEKKIKVRNRYFNYVVLKSEDSTVINKRIDKDIWTNLYDFPLIETNAEVNESDFLVSKEWKKLIGKNKHIVRSVSAPYKHILSHQKIYARFWEIDLSADLKKIAPDSSIIIKQKDIHKYAVPRLIENYLNSEKGKKVKG
ncbi:MAG: A/G-specific adenine glycosylase [Bacteroidota bacterium]|jgi:A/G-specific adenine glycosylase|nr:A/G-specific adenine glycosylase [Bacteroidota bacterium]